MLRGDLEQELARRVAAAVREAHGLAITPDEALIRVTAPGRPADYQSNAAMGLARRLRLSSEEVAAGIIGRLDTGGILEPPTADGPGFINLVIRREWLEVQLAGLLADERLGVEEADPPRRVVIDYSSPNIAKEMHAGNLRSTIIGDALARLLRFRGHEVIPQNHFGDWGTPLGMVLEHLADEGGVQGGRHTLADLNALYQQARSRFDADPDFAGRARRRVVALQAGDPETVAVWREFIAETQRYLSRVYETMGVLLRPEHDAGESMYEPMLGDVIAELESLGLTAVSDGALVAFPPGFTGRDGRPLPLILRKRDGGYGYDTTDLAAIRYRARDLRGDDLLYVVGADHHLHFAMIFATAAQAGWLHEGARAVHVAFGLVLGPDGKRFRTRSGDAVRLLELTDEAVNRAAAVVAGRSELSPGEREHVAHAVGVGAIKYADLSSDRVRDYVFDWDRMLAMDGNTSVYLQYANARVRSVLSRAAGGPPAGTALVLEDPAERALGLKLAQFPTAVETAIANLQPHRLCTYLYETAVAFSAFYDRCSILGAESPQLRASRLTLCELTSRVIAQGLGLLGIEAPERL